VAPDGQVLDPRPIKLYNMPPSGLGWAVASDGSGWVVVNQSSSVGPDVVAARISSVGVLLDPGPRVFVPGTYYSRSNLQLVYAGGVFLLAYQDLSPEYLPAVAIRFDANLNPLDAAPFDLGTPTPLNSLVSNGSGFYTIWIEQLPDLRWP
jgi:hypothetical protein